MIRDIRNHFEHEEEDYYKPVRVGNFWSNKYIEYKSKSNRKALSVKRIACVKYIGSFLLCWFFFFFFSAFRHFSLITGSLQIFFLTILLTFRY